jgi:hypothetical protein
MHLHNYYARTSYLIKICNVCISLSFLTKKKVCFITHYNEFNYSGITKFTGICFEKIDLAGFRSFFRGITEALGGTH